MPVFEHFFKDIDAGWKWPCDGKILLKVLGSAAPMLLADYERGTSDGDVLETEQLDAETHVIRLRLTSNNLVDHQGKATFQVWKSEKFSIGDEIRTVLYRSVRELLYNAVKHAQANTVQISIGMHAGGLQVPVVDDGVGFDVTLVDNIENDIIQ